MKENLFEAARFILGDILDYSALMQAMSDNYDAIIHLAALKAAGESMQKPEKYAENNIIGTINITLQNQRTFLISARMPSQLQFSPGNVRYSVQRKSKLN